MGKSAVGNPIITVNSKQMRRIIGDYVAYRHFFKLDNKIRAV